MMNDEMKRPDDQQTSGEDGTADRPTGALQSFADIIQEKAGLSPVEDENTSGVVADEHAEPLMATLHDLDTSSIVWKVKEVLRRQPIIGVTAGVVVGFAIGRTRR